MPNSNIWAKCSMYFTIQQLYKMPHSSDDVPTINTSQKHVLKSPSSPNGNQEPPRLPDKSSSTNNSFALNTSVSSNGSSTTVVSSPMKSVSSKSSIYAHASSVSLSSSMNSTLWHSIARKSIPLSSTLTSSNMGENASRVTHPTDVTTERKRPLSVRFGERSPFVETNMAPVEKKKNLPHREKKKKARFLILVFIRGSWCQDCVNYLQQLDKYVWERVTKDFGGNMAAVISQNEQQAIELKKVAKLRFEVVSDERMILAQKYDMNSVLKGSIVYNKFHHMYKQKYINNIGADVTEFLSEIISFADKKNIILKKKKLQHKTDVVNPNEVVLVETSSPKKYDENIELDEHLIVEFIESKFDQLFGTNNKVNSGFVNPGVVILNSKRNLIYSWKGGYSLNQQQEHIQQLIIQQELIREEEARHKKQMDNFLSEWDANTWMNENSIDLSTIMETPIAEGSKNKEHLSAELKRAYRKSIAIGTAKECQNPLNLTNIFSSEEKEEVKKRNVTHNDMSHTSKSTSLFEAIKDSQSSNNGMKRRPSSDPVKCFVREELEKQHKQEAMEQLRKSNPRLTFNFYNNGGKKLLIDRSFIEERIPPKHLLTIVEYFSALEK